MQNKLRTLDQKRSDFALKKVMEMNWKQSSNDDEKNEIKALTSSIPSMIKQMGIGLTMAFLLSKAGTSVKESGSVNNKNKYRIVVNIIKEWLGYKSGDIDNSYLLGLNSNLSDEDFIKKLNDVDQFQYMTIQNEAIAIMEWVKKYTVAGFHLQKKE